MHPGIVRTNIVRKESALLRGFINFFFGLALKDETLALSLWNESLRLLHLGPDSV
ncbi:hypothetical protein B566_EDAN013135 [Ephemera danica]|nr:hypothetical protein B566_EDAN013135 [Ephemera danica]